VMASLAEDCKRVGVDQWDTNGDFNKRGDESFLKGIEEKLANEFGKADAVFMPSGVMAQSIALLIHASSSLEFPRLSLHANILHTYYCTNKKAIESF
jgi:hypothetical protein